MGRGGKSVKRFAGWKNNLGRAGDLKPARPSYISHAMGMQPAIWRLT
jgi:hypothetical protein